MEWKRISVVAATAALALTTAACSSSGNGDDGGTPANTGGGNTSSAPSGSGEFPDQPASKIQAAEMTGDCADYGKYGKYDGTTVTVYTSITNPELQYHVDAAKKFEECTGIDVKYQGTKDFEGALKTKVQGGNAPDLAIFPQPGLLATFATGGELKLATDAVTAQAQENWVDSWIGYGTVDGLYFGAPLGANLKSLIWYSPKYFQEWGYEVPDNVGRPQGTVRHSSR